MGIDLAIDITANERTTVLALLVRHLPHTTAWIYGSRAKWTSTPKSDLDLVVFTTPEQRRDVADLREAFDESNLPFRVDLFVWDEVPDSFRRRIESERVTLVGTVESRSDFYGLPVSVPPLPEQRGIAHTLGILDDKIELSRRMNATLEAMARALFQSWFVDFDPVRAKMEGRDPGLPKEVADLFPDRLAVDSELGEVPESWAVGVLDDAVELLNGGTPRTSVEHYWNGDIRWYTAKDSPAPHDVFVVETERTVTQAGVDNSATTVLPPRTTVISARGSVGRLACLGRSMAMNQTCYGIRGAGGYRDFFTYWLVRTAVEDLRSRTHGTIFDITRQTFALVDVALPSVRVAGAFESVVMPIMERILSNLHQSQAIAVLRDTLLPKLVSGELRVTGLDPSLAGGYQDLHASSA